MPTVTVPPIDDRRLADVFRREMAATGRLESALHAVAADVLARLPEPGYRVVPEDADIRLVLELAAADAGVTVERLVDRSVGTRRLSGARWVAMAVLRRRLRMAMRQIAHVLDLVNHATVNYGIRCVDQSPELSRRAAAIVQRFDAALAREAA